MTICIDADACPERRGFMIDHDTLREGLKNLLLSMRFSAHSNGRGEAYIPHSRFRMPGGYTHIHSTVCAS